MKKNIHTFFVVCATLIACACTEVNLIQRPSDAGSGGSAGDEGCTGDSGEGGSDNGSAGSGESGGSAGEGGSSDSGGSSGSSGDGGSAGSSGDGGTSGSSGDTGSGGSGGVCVQELLVERVSHETSVMLAGTQNFEVFTLRMLSTCEDLVVRGTTFGLKAPDFEEYDTAPFLHFNGAVTEPDAWNFNDIRLVDADNGSTIQGPKIPELIKFGPVAVVFNDVFTLEKGKPKTLKLVMDIPSAFPFLSNIRYHVDVTSIEYKNSESDPPYITDADGFPEGTPTFTVMPLPTKPLKVRMIKDHGGGIASLSYLVPFLTYEIENPGEAERVLRSISVQQIEDNGDWRDFGSICLVPSGSDFCAFFFNVPSSTGIKDVIEMPAQFRVVVPPHEKVTLELNAWMASPIPRLSANGEWHGVPRSGHEPALKLIDIIADDEKRADIALHDPVPSILRKTQPSIAFMEATDTVLRNGTMSLIDFNVNAFQVGEMALKQIRFWMLGESGYLSNPRLLLAGSELSPIDYKIVVGVDQRSITVVFTGEEFVSTNAKRFTLRADMNGVISGSTFQIGLESEINGTGNTAVPVERLDGTFGLGEESAPKALIWSDRSEIPHGLTSLDWTDGLGVLMEGMNTFVAP